MHAGFVESRDEYWALIRSCNVVVSTAIQENFGLAVVEAMMCGCLPVLPDRLSYPELLPADRHADLLYATDEQLSARLSALCDRQSPERSRVIEAAAGLPTFLGDRFGVPQQTRRLDAALHEAVESRPDG